VVVLAAAREVLVAPALAQAVAEAPPAWEGEVSEAAVAVVAAALVAVVAAVAVAAVAAAAAAVVVVAVVVAEGGK
jgi:hypothetical protein